MDVAVDLVVSSDLSHYLDHADLLAVARRRGLDVRTAQPAKLGRHGGRPGAHGGLRRVRRRL